MPGIIRDIFSIRSVIRAERLLPCEFANVLIPSAHTRKFFTRFEFNAEVRIKSRLKNILGRSISIVKVPTIVASCMFPFYRYLSIILSRSRASDRETLSSSYLYY